MRHPPMHPLPLARSFAVNRDGTSASASAHAASVRTLTSWSLRVQARSSFRHLRPRATERLTMCGETTSRGPFRFAMQEMSEMHVLNRACSLRCGVGLRAQAAAQAHRYRDMTNSLSGAPIAGASVTLDELRRRTTANDDGVFTFDNVPPGVYHVSILADGYSSRRSEVTVAAGSTTVVDVRVDPELHFQEVLSVSADARSQFEAFQPTSVLAGQELQKQLESSVGETLEDSARRRGAQLRSGAGASRHPRPGRRSRPHPAGRAAHGRPVEPVGRSRGDRESGGGAAHRGRARTGDAPLRRQRGRRARQHHHRRHSDAVRRRCERQLTFDAASRGEEAAPPGARVSAMGRRAAGAEAADGAARCRHA